jgi:Leucine rich repeat
MSQSGNPSHVSALYCAEKLNLFHMNLRGTIPANIFTHVTRLTELDLQGNELTGPIPTTLGYLKDIQILILGHNKLSGSLPRQIGLMVDLQMLNLQDNNIGGSIPNIISALKDLQELRLSRNVLQGRFKGQRYYGGAKFSNLLVLTDSCSFYLQCTLVASRHNPTRNRELAPLTRVPRGDEQAQRFHPIRNWTFEGCQRDSLIRKRPYRKRAPGSLRSEIERRLNLRRCRLHQ